MLPKTKNDLIAYYVDYPGKPQNVRCSFKTDSKEGIVFTTYRIPDVKEFSTLASVFVKRFVNVPDFFVYLKDIVETAVKLRLLAQYMQFHIQEQKPNLYQHVRQEIQSTPFHVVMPDAMSKKDRLRYKKTKLKLERASHRFIDYSMDKMDVFFDVDEKANDFFAIIPKLPFVIKATMNTNKKMKNVLREDSQVFSDFIDMFVSINEYCDTPKINYTQKSWDDFLFKSQYDTALSCIQENVVNPSIMHLVDQTRRFLCKALVSDHGSEIASNKALATFKLKENKPQIYKLAEKYGYLEKAEPFLFCEDLRNQIAHPEKNIRDIMQKALNISNLYSQFVFRFIDEDFIVDYYEKTPISIPLDELNVQYRLYQNVRQAELISDELKFLLPDDLKHKKSQKRISFLNKEGIINHEEFAKIEQLFLNRNAAAHGQTNGLRIKSQFALDFPAIRHALVHRQHS